MCTHITVHTMKGKRKVCTLEKRRDRNPRTVVDTPPDLKAEYASFCQAMGITVSERTRALWLRDMGYEDERDTAA